MKDSTKYDEFALKATMSLINDSITSCNGADGFCHKLLNIAATLICDSSHNFQDLLKSALNTSPEMSVTLKTVMREKYNMIDISNMDTVDMDILLYHLNASPEMFDVLKTTMRENYNMIDADMSIEDMEKFLRDKGMTYKVCKLWLSTLEDKVEQLHLIKDLLDYLY